MGLRIVYEDGIYRPVVFCDRCSERIEKAAEGNYVWHDASSLIMFEHKGCHIRDHMFSEELSHLPIYLGNSLEVDWDKARRRIEMLASIE